MRLVSPVALVALAATALPAQQPTPATPASQSAAAKRPPIRALGAVVATSAESFVNVQGVRALSGGRVLVNDPMGRRVVMFDPALSTATVVADSTSATANAYGGRFGGLLAYRGDSTLFVDPASLSMLVIDAAGKVGRVMSVPRSQDVMALTGITTGVPGFDGSGRLVYRQSPRFDFRGGAGAGGGAGLPAAPPKMADSAALVRVDLATRAIDTVAWLKISAPRMQMVQEGEGRVRMQSEFNPLPLADDWAVLSDGTIAIVRGRDYHVDLIRPDGSKVSAPKLPFEWQRLTDEDKVAFIDSVKAQRERQMASGGAGAGMPGGGVMMQMQVREGGPAGGGAPRAREGATAAAGTQTMIGGGGGMTMTFIPPNELPDYKPPFLPNSTRADAQGNLWVRTIPTRQIPGGPVYDVIDASGTLIDRVQVPEGRTIVGFGPDGSVFMTFRDGNATKIERAALR